MGTRDVDIFKQCSGGAILRGVLHGMNGDVFRVTYRQMVEISDKVKLDLPKLKLQKETGKNELNSKQELDAFYKSIINTEIASDSQKMFQCLYYLTENSENKQAKKETKFYSQVRYTMFPAKSVCVSKEDLTLSYDALNALSNIHKQTDRARRWERNDNRRHLYHLCKEFFMSFGSHFHCGIFHLGSILTSTATFEGKTDLSEDTITKMVSASLDAYENAGLNETMSAKEVKGIDKSSGNFVEADLENIRLSSQQYSGLSTEMGSTKDKRKHNLIDTSQAWIVIDRPGIDPEKNIGVWDLLPEDGFDGKRERLHNILFEFFSTYFYRDQIYRIMATGTDSESIRKALLDMKDITGRCHRTNRVAKEWWQLLLDDESVVQFLLATEHHLQNFSTQHLNEIGTSIAKLLWYVNCEDFKGKGNVIQLRDEIRKRIHDRENVKKLLAEKCDPDNRTNYLNILLEKVCSLSAVEWARILREDANAGDKLLEILTETAEAKRVDDKTRAEINDLVDKLVAIAGQETFPNRNKIEKALCARPEFDKPIQNLAELLKEAHSSPEGWVRKLREDTAVSNYLLEVLTETVEAKCVDDKTEINDLVHQLVAMAGQETFPHKDEIQELLCARPEFTRPEFNEYIQYLRQQLQKARSLSAVEWARILREDAVSYFLFEILIKAKEAKSVTDETRTEINDLVLQLVAIAEQETFPHKDEIKETLRDK